MEYLEKIFKKTGWISILESIIFAVLGVILISNPEKVVTIISYILGILFILIGIYKIIKYWLSKGKYSIYHYDMIYGLTAIVIGIIIMIYSNTIGSVFRIAMGIWIIYSSFVRMNLSIELKRIQSNIWIYSLLLAIIMFICGLYITINSGAVIITLGISIIIYSVIDLIENIIFMKNVKELF